MESIYKVKPKLNMITIVCYGDSNTRYYEGDLNCAGPISNAFSSVIEKLCQENIKLCDTKVINAGYPGENILYGLNRYAENIRNNNTDIAIIGFGTNDIKIEHADIDNYLSSMELMIKHLEDDHVPTIILGIPWFEKTYAGDKAQNRLLSWSKKAL